MRSLMLLLLLLPVGALGGELVNTYANSKTFYVEIDQGGREQAQTWLDQQQSEVAGYDYCNAPAGYCHFEQDISVWDRDKTRGVLRIFVYEGEPPTSADCAEQGLVLDGKAYACVDLENCSDGALGDGSGNYTCLSDVEDPQTPNDSEDPNTNNECRKDSNDYKGVFNGKFYCDSNLPEAPSCQKGTAHLVDNGNGSYGFACAATPEKPGDAETEDKETTSVIEDDEKRIERTVNEKTGAVTTRTTDKTTGETTVTITYPGTDSQTGKPCTEDSLLCYPSENTGFCKDGNSLCEDVKDIKEWLTDGDGQGKGKDKGAFDMDGVDQQIADAEAKLNETLDTIKAEFGQYFDFDAGNPGNLTCPYIFEAFDQDIALCPDEYKEELKILGQMVLVLAAFVAVVLIARSEK